MVEKLKSEIEHTFGRKISYQRDCIRLSSSVLESTKEYISPATLRRVFGFLPTNSNPSRVTLDILSRFVGYKDWEDFNINCVQCRNKTDFYPAGYWEIVLENSKTISSNTVERIKLKSGIDFECTVKREFAEDRLADFIKNPAPATALIAPGGYGKSTLLAHWVLNQQRKKNRDKNVLLFIPAHLLDQFAPSEIYIDVWLMRLLGLEPDSNFIGAVAKDDIPSQGKFIFIVDALDEITSQGARQEKILNSLADLAEKFSTSPNLKLIISTRQSNWKTFSSYIHDKSKWYFTHADIFTRDGANIPPFSMDEIQSILDNTINKQHNSRMLVYEMHPDLREIIAYPYFLQLFIQTFVPEKFNLPTDQIDILSEFLKKQVYFSQYSDEKIDILNQIILLSDYGLRFVSKDELKNIYPIHLRLSGNYYTAYEELNSYGIIVEETQVDTFGGYSKYIRIANQQMASMLVVQNLIRKEQGVNKKLLSWIDTNLADNELQPSVLETLFKLTYKERLVEVLFDFFRLNNTTLERALASPTIPATLRNDSYMRNILVPHYAQQPAARKLLFEGNIDFNHLVDSFSFLIKQYLIHSRTEDGTLFANTLLAYIGFISMDSLAFSHFNASRQGEFNVLKPTLAGIWFANHTMYESFMGSGNPDSWINLAINYSKSLLNHNDRVDFAEFLLPMLVFSKREKYFPNFIELNDKLTSQNHRSAICFLLTKFYRLSVENSPISSTENSTIGQIFSILNPLRSYPGIILGEVLRASYYIRANNLKATHGSYRSAIELSGVAGYKLAEALLMKNLSHNLDLLNERQKAKECIDYVDSLWKSSGFKRKIS